MPDLRYEASIIKEVYTTPLRSALMIDDRFPTYQDLIAARGASPDANVDFEGAAELMAECRSRNLLCDVQNRVEAVPAEQLKHLTQSDLVVLDYHLDPNAPNDPEKALRVLAHLATSDHANLVVVYTLEAVETALRMVAARFKGASDLGDAPKMTDDQEDFIQDWNPELSEELIDLYILGDKNKLLNPSLSSLPKELSSEGIRGKDALRHICEVIERYLRKVYLLPETKPGSQEIVIEMSATKSTCKWVSFANVFIVFVSKKDGPKSVFPKLEEALLDWDPLPMRLMLAHVRNSFDAGGFVFEKQLLSDPAKLTGWFYHALTGDEPVLDDRLKQLWARLLESLRGQLTQDVAAFGSKLLQPAIASLGDHGAVDWRAKSLALAKDLAGAKADAADTATIIHALNAFLCSEDYAGSHIKTGTICKIVEFDGVVAGQEEWLLCSSPACEMVPRAPRVKGAWPYDLDPIMAVTVLRLSSQQAATPLTRAEEGKHIFLRVAGEPARSFEVLDATTGQPRAEGIFVTNRGQTEPDGSLGGFVVRNRAATADNQGGLAMIPIQLKAVAQLRSSYASRFLHQLGQHSSRIGVDFVNTN